MKHSYRVSLLAFACLSACTSTQSDPIAVEMARVNKLAQESIQRSKDRDRETRVNDNWHVSFTTDPVTKTKRFCAAAFGQPMGHDGTPYGSKSIPFQIVYHNNYGPLVEAGLHTYPGEHPIVRVDENAPVTVHDDGGVSGPEPDPGLVKLLVNGRTARVRYYSWPDGSRDMIVDLTGIDQAWSRLTTLRSGSP